jgi:hypothetical protein
MYLRETKCEGLKWLRIRSNAVVGFCETLYNKSLGSIKAGNFLTSCGNINFSRKISHNRGVFIMEEWTLNMRHIKTVPDIISIY